VHHGVVVEEVISDEKGRGGKGEMREGEI